jgi:aspartyl-tRNA(Asn)/glutamyl-tRNA(Gln) amidotransferase subunit B
MPVLNGEAVRQAVKMIVATGGSVRRRSVFARKNYFYPDLPKGFQISQYEEPIGEGGRVVFDLDGKIHRIALNRIHLEEDAGKSFHGAGAGSSGPPTDCSLIDMNRCGVPLLEIVTEPEIRSPRQAYGFLLRLRQVLQYLDICSGDMEKGALRCDVNLSIRRIGRYEFGTRTEIKNLNSFHGVEQALAFEMSRQVAILESGGHVVQETRLWNEQEKATRSMRSKEESHDYRYFPEPDLADLIIPDKWIEEIRGLLPELPHDRFIRFTREYGLPAYDAEVLTAYRRLADYVEDTIRAFPHPKRVSNWIMTEVLRAVKGMAADISRLRVTPAQIAELLKSIDDGAISGKIAKDVFAEMVNTGEDPSAIVARRGLSQLTDERVLGKLVAEIVDKHPENVELYRGGKKQLLAFFVGEVMKATDGRANPRLVNQIVREHIDGTQA